MLKKTGKYLFALIVFMWSTLAVAEVQVTATVSSNEIKVGDFFDYRVTVRSDESVNVAEPRLPSVEAFKFVSRSKASSTNTSLVNGEFKVVRQEVFIYRFQSTKKGKFNLGSTEVTVSGETHRTNRIAMTVKEGGGVAGRGSSRPQVPVDDDDPFSQLLRQRGFGGYRSAPPENLKQAFFIQVEVDKTEVFVGEQVTASWYIYTRYNISDIDTLKYPTLKKFWKEDIEVATRLNFTQEIVNGIPYRRALLARFALFPIKPGKAFIDEYKAKCEVILSGVMGSFGFGRPRSYTRSSRTVAVNVKELPKEGKPQDFSGAVGTYKVESKVSSDKVKLNEPFSYTIRFDGSGNAKRIDLPHLDVPDSLEQYDEKSESKYFKSGKSYKEFEVLFIPREPGKITIPGFTFSYFEPSSKSYVQRVTDAIDIEVLPGTGLTENNNNLELEDENKNTKKRAGLPGPIVEWKEPGLFAKFEWEIWIGAYGFALLLLIGKSLVAFGLIQVRRDLQKHVGQRFKKVYRYHSQEKWRDVGAEALNVLNLVLAELSGEGGANESVVNMVRKLPPSVRQELEGLIQSQIAQIEALSFAPEEVLAAVDKKKVLKDLKDLEKGLSAAIESNAI